MSTDFVELAKDLTKTVQDIKDKRDRMIALIKDERDQILKI